MRVMAQLAMVMNLDKCIGCHTCSVTCKQAWTNRTGTEYVWFNNVETRPGQGYPRRYEDQEEWKGGWTLNKRGRLALRAGGAALDRAVDDILENFGKGPLIFNLGHGILPDTPIAHVEQTLKRLRRS